MRIAHHCGLGDLRMGNQRAFNLGRTHPVARDVDHVIDPPRDPVIAIGIAAAAVAGEVIAAILAEIGLLEALMIAPKGAHLARPAVGDAQNTLGGGFGLDLGIGGIKDHRLHPKERLGGRPRLLRHGTRQRRDQMPPRFRLPERIDDRAFALADMGVVPVPRFGVDRLADRPQQLEAGEVVLFHPFRPLPHQRADRGRRGVELVDLVLGADLPEAACIGIGRNAFKHHRGRAIRQRTIDDIAVTCDPTHIGGAPEHIAIMVIEGHLMRHRRKDQIPA